MTTTATTRYLFVTGGVCSSLGKGITAAAFGRILIDRGLRVRNVKLDPYLNVDPGTLGPGEHGEVFVTRDGVEADLDLGHYERFTGVASDRNSSLTAGAVYQSVLAAERRGTFLGRTIQAVPHLTDAIIGHLHDAAAHPDGGQADVVVAEIGGTVGDIEIQIFLQAVRQMSHADPGHVAIVHLVLVPSVGPNREVKTKPAQHSVAELSRFGVRPDILIARSSEPLGVEVIDKLRRGCAVANVVGVADLPSIYAVPELLVQSGCDAAIAQRLGLVAVGACATTWREAVAAWDEREGRDTITVGLVGKYREASDAYLSVREAVRHAAGALGVSAHVRDITSDEVGECDAVVVPGGFGSRGTDEKIAAVDAAFNSGVPFLGLCLGMQVAAVAAARRGGKTEATSREWSSDGLAVVDVLDGHTSDESAGGTLRKGARTSVLDPTSWTHELYGAERITERFRHRYELTTEGTDALAAGGLRVVGRDADSGLVTVIERSDRAGGFYIGTQAHPEFASRPDAPHPLFVGLLDAGMSRRAARRGGATSEH